MSDPVYVDSINQRSAHPHVHLRGTDECVSNEGGELCPTWKERAEAAEAKVAAVERTVWAWPAYTTSDRSDYGRGVAQCREAMLVALGVQR